MRLAGKVAIITGAGSGIGRACALAFAREGAKVTLVGRTRAKLDHVAGEMGASAFPQPGDVRKQSDIERIVQATVERFGGLNVLVNDAAVLHAGTVESQTEAQWDETFATNAKGMWQFTRAAVPHLRNAGGGSVINISSVIGLVGAKNRAAYSASKGAVTVLTRSMALDLAADQIRVNCICPGIVATELVEKFITEAPDPEAARRQRIALHPLGRFGRPEDIAPMAVYLASDESSWVTGAAFAVDGGYSAI